MERKFGGRENEVSKARAQKKKNTVGGRTMMACVYKWFKRGKEKTKRGKRSQNQTEVLKTPHKKNKVSAPTALDRARPKSKKRKNQKRTFLGQETSTKAH